MIVLVNGYENYINGWKGVAGFSYARFLVNSMFLAVVAIIGNMISCSMTSFAFAKLQFKLNKALFAILLLTLMLPFHVKLIPTYIIYNTLHWVDTFLPLTVPTFFATNGFYCFLMVQFMRTMSNELLEAPRIDGCNTFQIYIRFILPLSSPVLVTVAIFTFISVWNDFMSQMIYLSNPRLFTVSLALRMFVDATGQSSYGSLFAMSIVSLIPLFVVFIIFQRHLIEGITTGSLKG
ncbi:MAG: carbohydrate ABC transporter permease [Treponema sp.]|jgi:multiple sugar transport system permease protein|nr:carbohydrate ABC transporter permease [Treponema sp.]